ncbi:hypothetical protein [Synechococcus phage Ssp-JY39]|nr:hypothetical protein [Synechococcus phage Yong-M2-251]
MRMIRRFFFGGLAMLAAVMFLTAPSRAIDFEPTLSGYSLDWPDAVDVVVAVHKYVPKPAMNGHAVAYASQNHPMTSSRFAVDAYSRIDPHIVIS